MALHELIRNYIQNNQGKHFVYERLIRDLIDCVSQEHNLKTEEVLKTCENFLENRKETKTCKGVVASKNNTPCTCPAIDGQDYCKRHLSLKEFQFVEPNCCQGKTKVGSPCHFRATHGNFCKRHQIAVPIPEKTRCCGENQDGTRCVRDARDGDTLCGLHQKKAENAKIKKTERMPCAFYDIKDDSFCFCTKHARNDKWFCSKHVHLQTQYASMYRSKNLSEYLSDTNYKNDVIEQLLKENSNE
jgi:hypothetical protein